MADLAVSLHPNIQRELIDRGNIATSIGLKTTPVVVFNGSTHWLLKVSLRPYGPDSDGKTAATIKMGDGSEPRGKAPICVTR